MIKDGKITDDFFDETKSNLDIGLGITGIHCGRAKKSKHGDFREFVGEKRDVTKSATYAVAEMMSREAERTGGICQFDFGSFGSLIFKTADYIEKEKQEDTK